MKVHVTYTPPENKSENSAKICSVPHPHTLPIPYMNNSKISACPALNISKLYTFEIQ